MTNQSAASASRAYFAGLSLSTTNSAERNLKPLLRASLRGRAWVRGVAWLAAALMLLGAFCVPAQAQTLAPIWTQLSPGTSPQAGFQSAMTYDPIHSQAVLFGGVVEGSYSSNTWLWNGSTWTLAASSGPSARSGSAMAFDAISGKVVLFGGVDANGNAQQDTWLWNGSSWSQVALSGNPANNPPKRFAASMVYDAALGEIVLFGGTSANNVTDLNDTWVWNGSTATWTQVNQTGPSARDSFGMAYDSVNQEVVLFGGYTNTSYSSETWTFDGTNYWVLQSPANSPPGRDALVMAYDPELGETVMFGGINSQPENDTWEWNGTTWTNVANNVPSARWNSVMTYDAEQGQLILFSGWNAPLPDDTWTWGTQQDLGNVNVCPTGQSTPAPCSSKASLTYNVNGATYFGTPQVVVQGAAGNDFTLASGSTCVIGAPPVGTCTVNVTFTPQAPGLRMGAVNLVDAGNNLLATTLIYGVGEGPEIAFAPGTQTTVPAAELNSGQADPQGIAVDAAGNVYIADTGNKVVLKVTPGGVQTTVPFTGLSAASGVAVDGAGDVFVSSGSNVVEITPLGVQTNVNTGSYGLERPVELAVDGAGDLFIADPYDGQVHNGHAQNGYVVEVPANGSAPTLVYSPAQGNPVGAAVDAAGDVFVADQGLAQVVEVPAGCTSSSCQITVGSGWSSLAAVAVDPAGDVFVADQGLDAGSGEVVEIPAGCTSSNCQIVMAAGTFPPAVAVDAAGDVFVANGYTNQVVEINQAQPPSESFDTTYVGFTSTDSPQSFTAMNVGNQTLSAILPGFAVAGPNFYQVSGTGTPADCIYDFSLAPGAACNVSTSFMPQVEGNLTSTATFTDNSLNAASATQQAALSGSALNSVETLILTGAGTGSGSVTASPTGINCNIIAGLASGPTCSSSYTGGEGVSLEEVPASGYTFAGWGGACASAGTSQFCNINVNTNGATNVTASFSLPNFGAANVCPAGSGPAPCSTSIPVTFNFNNNLTMVASAQVVTQGNTTLDFQDAGGTCSNQTYNQGDSCTVNVTFTPQAVGLRLGSVELLDRNGNILLFQFISGIGQAPVAAFSPLSTFGRYLGGPNGNCDQPGQSACVPLNAPRGVAVNATGPSELNDIYYIADSGNSQVLELQGNNTNPVYSGGPGSAPQGVAVDGAGNLFIADDGLGEVQELEAGCNGCQNVPYGPYGSGELIGALAVDGSGDLFIPDATQGWVVEITPNGFFPFPVGAGWVSPAGAATDAAGDLFVADPGIPAVVEVLASGSSQTTIGSGWVSPQSVAVDAAGDVYVSDIGLHAIVEVPAGCTSPACQITVVSGVTSYGVAVDPTGVVSYVDFNSGALVEVLQQFYGLGFSPSLVGNISGDSPKSVTLQNVGNQTLSATGPGLAFPDPDFYQTPRSGTPADCTSAFSLVSGATCNVSIDFDPLSAGMLNGSATFTDNGLNNSPYSQSFSLSGIGIPGSGSNILTVTGSGAGRGSVASGDTLISCSLSGGNATGVCAAAYSSGTVTLTAAPAANSAFAGWSGACASYGTTAQCTVAMNQSQNVTAKFVQGYLGTVSVCADGNPSGCTGTSQTVTFNFIASTTVSSVQVVTQGQPGLDFQYGGSDTCSGNTFSSGQSCTVTVAFTPTAPGLRLGAVELLNNGSVVATRLVYGIGQGPAISFNPATQVSVNVQGNFTLGANYVAVDAAGDVFISDDRNGQIVEVAAASGTTTTIAGVATPQGLALDGAGDLFVAEAGTPGEVVEFTPPCTNISCQNVVYNPGGSSSPGDVAIDGAGDLFIADVGLHEVVEIPAGGATQTVVYPSSPNSNSVPGGVAVDAAGDLFVADSGLKTVVELPANGGAQIPFGGLWISPTSVAVDAAGDVYVTDTGLTEAVEVPPSCSGPNAAFSCMVSLSNLADFPATSLALDSLGDVFVAEPSQDQVLELQASLSATVSFGEVGEGYRSNYGSPQFDTPLFIQNIGNGSQPLTGSVGPISGAYYFEDSSGTTCTSFTLASAATCVENLYFYPQNAVGLLNASAAVTDNTLSASPATQNINLAGFSYGLPVTVSVTGTGSGSVSSDPQLVNCAIVAGVPTGGGCSASVNTGFTYSFFESAISGYVFTGWGGACSSYGSNQICNVEIIGPTSIIANFAPAASYTLTVADVGTGSGSVSSNSSASPAINNCAISNGLVTGTCSENDPSGAQVILTASANGTSTFVGWGGACAGSGASATCNVTINSALSVSASFAAPGSSQSGVLKPITAGVVYGQGGSFTSNTANNGGISASSINSLADLVFDSSGNLYVSDALNARVLFYPAGSTTATRVYGQNGSFTTNTANSGGVSANSLSGPQGIALDSSGDLYVADESNDRVLFYPAGSTTATRVYGQGGSFTSNTANNGGVSANSLSAPEGIALDSSGNLYVADQSNNRVLFYPAGSTTATQVYGQGGSFTSNALNNGGLSANSLNQPTGVALDSSGDLYVADDSNNRVLFYSFGSTIATQVYGQPGFTTNYANNGGVSASSLNNPIYPALDSSGNLYVADTLNNRVLFYPLGSTTATRVYGQLNSFTSNTANNGGISANSLSEPWAAALDPSGNLYVTDNSNNRVLEYGSFGNINVCPNGVNTPAPCNTTVSMTFYAATTTNFGATQVVTQGITGLDFSLASGGTCTGTVSADNSCTVNVNFAPLSPGVRTGAVELFDSNANLLTTAQIYGVGQGPEIVFGPGVQTTVGSGLNQPQAVAVDAAGDVFISNYGLGQVLEVTPGGVQTTVPASGLANPYGVAVDGAGDVFIADPNNSQVVKVTPSGVQTTVGSVGYPYGVAVDAAGDVFIVDSASTDVVKVTPSGVQTIVPATGLTNPYNVAVDGAGDVFISDPTNVEVVEVTPSGVQTTVPATGLVCPYGVAVDAAGDVYISDPCISQVVEVSTSGVQTTVPFSGLTNPISVAVDGTGDVFTGNSGVQGVVTEMQRSQPPSFNFALTNVGSVSTDSPQAVSVQNIGNQALTGTLALNLGTNFVVNTGSSCTGGFSLAPGASCSESFSFTPQTTGYLTSTASFSDNTLNLSPLVSLQTVNLIGNGGLNGQAVAVMVPNVVGLTQAAAATPITGVGLVMGSVSTASSSIVPSGSVIASNPAAGTQVTPGSAVRLLVSNGQPVPPTPNPLSLENNYFVTGDYASAGVTLRGHGVGGIATGTITIPSSTTNPGVSQGVPDGADIIDGFLYWETLENTPSPSGGSGTFLGYPIAGQQIGSDLDNYTDGAFTGTLRVYRADVNTYFPGGTNGVRYASGAFTVSLPDSGGTGFPLTEGASLVVIYRVLSPNFPLKSVIIYDGSAIPTVSATQSVQGFYDALGGTFGTGESTTLFAAGGSWNNSSGSVTTPAQSSQYSAPLNAGNAYAAVILSTPVANSDNDAILDSWKAGPAAGDFYGGQPGYYDVKSGSWVPLPGAKPGQKDLFVQMDYMCGAVLPNGACDSNQENLFPSPDALGNDPLAMVTKAFAADGVVLHLEVGNAVPEDTCSDSASPQLCQFPGEPGVIGWKNSLEFSKLWPKNLTSCAAGGDCSPRFPYGQKDSYHYVLFAHSLAIPAWNSRYGSLTSIQVVNGVTTIGTTDRGTGINECPSRITISGVLGSPTLNGVYNTTSCPDSKTMTMATPGVPNWSYPNNTLPEPVIGLTSGTVTSISGYSDLGGADSAISLGLWETAPNQDMSKRANVIAGTLFHEIGHTLGLTHGGLYYDTAPNYVPNFDVNCKPNYQSSMNYLFQLDGVGPSAAIAYSNQQLDGLPQSGPAAILSLNSLGSVVDLTDASGNPAAFSTSAWYTSVAPSTTASAATMHCDGTPLTGDTGYRVDGPIAPIAPAWSSGQNITFDGVPYTTLRGYNDVTNIDLRQVGATGGEFASLASVLTFGSSQAPLTIAAGGSASVGAGGTVALGSGGNVTLGSGGNVTLGSAGTITLGSGGNVTLGSGGNVTLGSGGTLTAGSNGLVTLGSGGNVTMGSGGVITMGSGGLVTLGSGGLITLGSGGTITSSLGVATIRSSGGSYTLPAGGGIITLGSGGNVTLGSGGNVTLGSGGIIALGSGGLVTLGSGGNVTLGSGGIITMGSGGIITLGSGGNVTLGSGGLITMGSGGNVTLGSGGNVTLGSGGIITMGSGGNVTLGSGGNVTLGSGGTVTLGSGGNVTLGSGGNVTLGSGGIITMGSGGIITLGSGGTVTLGSGGTISGGVGTVGPGIYTIPAGGSVIAPAGGGTIALGSGGNVTLGSGGIITMGSGGTVTLGSGGNVTLGSGGVVALGSGGNVTLGSGGTIALGSGGTVTLGSGGASTDELTYLTANSVVRPPSSPTETPTGTSVVVNWTAPAFGVVSTYTISRSSDGNTPIVIGSVSGVSGNPPATTFTDTNPDLTSQTVVYTISTTLLPVTIDPTQRQSAPSLPAVLTNDQSIVLGSLPSSVSISSATLTVTATAESSGAANGLQVTFGATGSCTAGSQSIDPSSGVSSATLTLNSTGSCIITASQPGSNLAQPGIPPYYNPANSVSGTVMVLPQGSSLQSQTILFPQLPNVKYGSTFSLSASSSSGLQVSFTASGPCATSGSISGVGVCTITASAAANSTYSAASVTQSFTVYPAVLTVTATSVSVLSGQSLPQLASTYSGFVNNESASVVSGAPALSTTATSGSNPGPYPITVSTGTMAAANYSFLYVNGTLTIQTGNQLALTLITTSPLTFNQSEALSVTGGSTGGAVTYTRSSGPCTIVGAQLTANSGTGSCTLTATMAGNSSYNAVTSTPANTVILSPASQAITFTINPPAGAGYNSSFTVAATGGASGNPVTFTSSGECSNSGATYTMTSGTGTCSVIANQAGNANYAAATQVTQTVNPTLTTPTVTFTGAPSSAAYNSHFTVATTTNASTTAVITSSGACSNAGTTITMTSGTGTCSLTATWAADSNYSGTTASQSTIAGKIAPTVTFTGAPSSAAYLSGFTVAATTNASTTAAITSSGACSNAGTTITMTSGTGTCSLTATWAADSNYSGTTASQSTAAGKIAPTVTFTGAPSSAAYLSGFTVAATTNASTTAAITSSGACSNAGTTITMTSGTGTCSLSATWAADSNYSGTTASQSTAAGKIAPTVTFTGAPSSAAYNSHFTVATTTNASTTAVITSSGACSNAGTTITMTSGTGTCSLSATWAADSNYSGATASQSTIAGKIAPTVTFTGAPSSAAYLSGFTLATTTNASTTAVITSSGACSNTGTAVTMTSGTGTCSLSATWAADSNYNSATASQSTAATLVAQTITFTTSPPTSAAYNSTFTVAATGGASANPVTFTSAGACSNSGATYTMTNSTGTCSVIANQAGNTNYSAATQVTKTVTASGASVTVSPSSINFGTVTQGSITTQTITVTNNGTASVTVSDPILSIVKGGNSNEFVAVNLCLTPLAAGKSCTITIAFVAGPYYTPQTATLQIMDNAPGSPQPVTLSATVLVPQTITFTTNPPASAYNSSFTVAATGGGSGNAVTFTSSGACSNSGATYTMTSGTGTCSVIANQAGNSTYAAAAQVTKTVTATLAAQTITFTTSPPASAAYKSSFTVAATGGGSGNAVTFTSSGACSKSGTIYTMTSGTGTCSVIANQAANTNYAAAAQVTKTVTATVAAQAITFTTNPPASAAYKSTFTVAATGGASGNAVTFTSSGACTNSGATYTMTSGTGTCSVIANQAGNSNYSAAPPVTMTAAATLVAQAITFTTNPPASSAYKSSFKVAATGGGSGNAVTFTSSGACSNSGATYTMTSSTGTCSVIANQAGNSNYAAAAPVTKIVQ